MANRALLEKEIKEYCELNGINDIPGFITQCMLRGFNIFKYGTSPGDNIKRQNGEIIDNGSNRVNKKKEEPQEVKEEKIVDKQAEKEKEEVENNKSVIIKKRKKITVTSV